MKHTSRAVAAAPKAYPISEFLLFERLVVQGNTPGFANYFRKAKLSPLLSSAIHSGRSGGLADIIIRDYLLFHGECIDSERSPLMTPFYFVVNAVIK